MSSSLPSTLTSAEIQTHADYFSVVQADLVRFLDTAGALTREMERQRDELVSAVSNDDRVARTIVFVNDSIVGRQRWMTEFGEYGSRVEACARRGAQFAHEMRRLEERLGELTAELRSARKRYQDEALLDPIPVADWVERQVRDDVDAAYHAVKELEARVQIVVAEIRRVTAAWYSEISFQLILDIPDPPARKDKEADHSGFGEIDISTRNGEHIPPWRTDSNGFPSIDVTDVNQGAVGDCYFVAAIASIVLTRGGVQFIQRMIVDNGDGTFTVTFPGHEPIRLDGDVYANASGVPLYGRLGKDSTDYWFLLLEKAYAQMAGSWSAIAGGWSGDVFAELGLSVSSWEPGGSRESLEQMLRLSESGSAAVTAAVDLSRIFSGMPAGSNHALSVVNFEPGGGGTVVLRNPWGSNGNLKVLEKYSGSISVESGGYVRITLDVFEKTFHGATAGALP